jgi:hypothetical protein
MTFLIRSLSLSALCWLTVSAIGDTGESAKPRARGPGGQPVRKYTKEWRDDYHNQNRVIYHAYTKVLRDDTGTEVDAEIWHGRATGYHQNGRKAWEGDYREGKREGEFTMWAENGARTGLSQFERGRLHGTYTQWSADGRKMREETYRRDRLHGEARWWAPNGQPTSAGMYRDGLPWEGTFIELDPTPPRSRKVIRGYEQGKKVSEETVPGDWW